MANRYPLVVDTSDNNQIKEIPNGDNLLLTGNSITGVVDITASGNISAAGVVMSGTLTYQGNPLANIATTAAYSDLTGVPTNVSQFTNDANYRSNGDNVSVFTNDAGYLTTVAFNDLTGKPTTLGGYGIIDAASSVQGSLATSALQPGANISTLNNDSGFVTLTQLTDGTVTVDVNNSGDLVGSVFADDSTVMIDSMLGAVNLDGTIRGNVVPNTNQHNTWDLGTNAVRFKDAYFEGNIKTNASSIALGQNASAGSEAIAIGKGTAGVGDYSQAIGNNAGNTGQGVAAVALGSQSGETSQGDKAVAVGQYAGKTSQGTQSVAIGEKAGETTQSAVAVAIGTQAGMTTQGLRAIAIGLQAAEITQAQDAIAIGSSAGYNNQGQSAIAIGAVAGNVNQAARSIVISASNVAVNNIIEDSLVITPIRSAVGTTMLMYDAGTGEVTHTASPVITGDITGSVFGDDSTLLVDGNNNKIVGAIETASLRTSETKIALGSSAGRTTQGIEAIAIGKEAGKTTQGDDAVAVGSEAGEVVQGAESVAIGKRAGSRYQSDSAVALGTAAGYDNQGDSAVALGKTAGYDNQGDNAVAVGYGAGSFTQGTQATALGNSAGYTTQGASAIAIGYQAGYSNQAANSIVINATGNILTEAGADTFVVKPIRSAVGTTMLMYDASSGEITHTANPEFNFTGDITGSVFADNSTQLVDGVDGVLRGTHVGELIGSVFSDDSSVVINESGTVLGTIAPGAAAPASETEVAPIGEIRVDDSYVYVRKSTGWGKIAIGGWV